MIIFCGKSCVTVGKYLIGVGKFPYINKFLSKTFGQGGEKICFLKYNVSDTLIPCPNLLDTAWDQAFI